MINLYVYLILIIISFAILYTGTVMNFRYSPTKIKVLYTLVFSALFLRMTALVVLCFSQSISYLFLLKPFVFLNYIWIPMAMAVCLYIFLRSDKLNISYGFLIGAMLAVVYGVAMYKLPSKVQISQMYGYTIGFVNQIQVSYAFVIVNTVFAVLCILQTDRKTANKPGLYAVLITFAVCITETFLQLYGLEPVPQNIAGDLAALLTVNYSLLKLKN